MMAIEDTHCAASAAARNGTHPPRRGRGAREFVLAFAATLDQKAREQVATLEQ